MRALVTGGAGFIGSHLVDRLLSERHAVDVVDDLSSGSLSNLGAARTAGGQFRFHQIDVRDPAIGVLIERRRPEIVFHLAAQPSVQASVADPGHDADVNVVGSVRVIEGAVRAGTTKLVYAASGGTLYGDVRRAVDETQPYSPISPYGISKKIVIDYLAASRAHRGLEFTALALANVYGPRQRSDGEAGVVAIFAADIVAGRVSTINGDGNQKRDFVFVDDVVDAFMRAATPHAGGLVLNIGTGKGTSINHLYSTMTEQAGVLVEPIHGPPKPGEARTSVLSSAKAKLHLGWKPWTVLEDGISATLTDAARRLDSRALR